MTTVTAADALAAVGWLADQRATGVLRGPAGAVYLTDGLVVHAESDLAPDLAALLTRSGRIAPEAWHDMVGAFGPYGLVAGALVDQRRLTRGELEVSHLGVLFDAAYCVLTAGRAAPRAAEAGLRVGRPDGGAPGAAGFGRGASGHGGLGEGGLDEGGLGEGGPGGGQVGAAADDGEPGTEDWLFEPGVRHWLGPVSAVSAQRLCSAARWSAGAACWTGSGPGRSSTPHRCARPGAGQWWPDRVTAPAVSARPRGASASCSTRRTAEEPRRSWPGCSAARPSPSRPTCGGSPPQDWSPPRGATPLGAGRGGGGAACTVGCPVPRWPGCSRRPPAPPVRPPRSAHRPRQRPTR
ncbi:hypothetical protein [Kitasatospora sp. A2-31]|uniref:hypothetical protein n=1 Tax=Kitasatospora sp. A2-31 TaxID=2916414 RepID=UPI001EEA79A0|nr:hypothetical protein [Kitasatospora sp. A2-31]MCG6498121.1 hypothetical protein [Kitasatospora sp. A2-31]